MAFAAAITVREHVLRTALQSGYANGSDAGKKFTEDLSDSALGMEPDLFLGQPDINCEGSTNLLVRTMPMWGTVKVTAGGFRTPRPDVRRDGADADARPAHRPSCCAPEDSRRVRPIQHHHHRPAAATATVTSNTTPPAVASLITGNEFAPRFEAKFRQGVFFGEDHIAVDRRQLPGRGVDKASEALGRVRNSALLKSG